jgi:hypothetical protein
MKNLVKISKATFLTFLCIFIFSALSFAECTNQREMDNIINNPNKHFNRNVSVAGSVDRLLNEKDGGPGFVMKSREGKDFFVTGGDIVVDEDGNVSWQIKKDINMTDAYGEPIIALVLIKIYPGDYVALEGNIVKKEILNFAMTISNIESFKSENALTVSPNKNFHISISMPIHPNYDWVFSKNQSDFYCSSKARLIGDEMLAPTSGLIGTTNKNFIFKAGGSGFSSLKFDNLDYSDKNRPKRIDSKKYLILIE